MIKAQKEVFDVKANKKPNSVVINNIQKHKKKGCVADTIYTPDEVAEKMILMCQFKPDEVILDPCKGKGAFYDKIREPRLWCEITDKKDFFKNRKKVDWIIGNPPFSDLTRWLLKTMECCNKFCYILSCYSMTMMRFQMMEDRGFYITKMKHLKIRGWFMTQMIIIVEKLEKKPESIEFDYYPETFKKAN